MSSSSPRRLIAGALAAGALVGAAALPASAEDGRRAPARSTVVLGDIQYDSPGRDNRSNRSLNAEWVEVTNTGRSTVNLNGWTLSDRDGNQYTFTMRLSGRSTVRVHTGEGRDNRSHVYQGSRYHIWANNSDTATLRDRRDRVIDTESWGRRH
ncbi:lamin tail domain-containing protein [Streptomyces sp. NPDC058653]|uniref:lamin tail domain-containing protein n=1 Tax=Streptomyces sp. NPDC058653 TaxID=3346576 RepID=UPI0036606751